MAVSKSMTDVAFDCLSKRKKEVEFAKLWADVSKQMKIPENKLRKKRSQLYSELMLDPRFYSLEGNKWDLRNRRKFDEVHASSAAMDDDDDDLDEPLDQSGLDLPTGDDAYDN
ncbi:MAG: DNA-directed RNA polymerase subunit delta [Erysipelotrichaceae bacterium]|nr:DNA-directed RNA polymerase subunit delta [Erysipelotrichaceae bacterium]